AAGADALAGDVDLTQQLVAAGQLRRRGARPGRVGIGDRIHGGEVRGSLAELQETAKLAKNPQTARSSEDVAAEVLVLDQAAQLRVHVAPVDPHLAAAVGGLEAQ